MQLKSKLTAAGPRLSRRATPPLLLSLAWLAVITLLAGRLAATEQRAAENGPDILAPRLCALEQRLFDQIHNGRFGEFSLLEAGLIAGGVDCCDELQRYHQRFDKLVDALRQSGRVRGTACEQAQAIFAFLHRSILTGGYSLQASDLRQAFDHGRFNCVTASLLFNCLADRFELETVGLEVPGHAMSRLKLPGETLDIETTCPRWSKQLDHPKTANQKQDPREVTQVELVATIYYNRGVDLLAEKNFAAAAVANAKALRLDPKNVTAKGNYLATINNWAIALGVSGEYERAAELLRMGRAADPGYAAFHANFVQLFRQWSDHLCRDGHYDAALRLLTQAAKEEPGEKFFHEAVIEVLRRVENR